MVCLFYCKNYLGIIKIEDVNFLEVNDLCGNGIVYKKCLVLEDDKWDFKFVFERKCDGKWFCSIYLLYGVYKDMYFFCWDLNIRICIEIIYDCKYCKFLFIFFSLFF